MNAKQISKIIEIESRVNTIIKCLILGEVDHMQVEYCNDDVCIKAFSHSKAQSKKLGDLMRIWANPNDEMNSNALSYDGKPFWTDSLLISIR